VKRHRKLIRDEVEAKKLFGRVPGADCTQAPIILPKHLKKVTTHLDVHWHNIRKYI